MTSLLGFRTGTQLVTTFSMIAGAFDPSGSHMGTCKLRASISASFASMAQQYGHIVSIATSLFRILSDEQSNTHWKLSEVCQHDTNYLQTKFEMQTGTFHNSTGETKYTVLQNHRQKFTLPFSTVQVTQVEVTHTIHQLLMFDVCGLVNPVSYVLAVRGRVLHGQPMPIPHVYQQLLANVRAVCAARADVFGRVVYLHARQGWCRNNFQSSHHTAIILTKD